jgi:transcription-repair coupling factor (superfamily II helicase)
MLEELKNELRDRFGPPPAPVELALKVAALKIAAAARGVTVIETKEDKLMLQRNQQYVTAEGKFPRLRRKGPAARLNEIIKAVLTLEPTAAFRVPTGTGTVEFSS